MSQTEAAQQAVTENSADANQVEENKQLDDQLTLDYLLNEPVKFIQDYYLQKSTVSDSLDSAKVSFSISSASKVLICFVFTAK